MKSLVNLPVKRLIISFMVILVSFWGLNLNAQKNQGLYPIFGFGIGFFYPNDVNEYIADAYSGYILQGGTIEMFMFLEGHAGLTYKMKFIDFTGLFEYGIAPKIAYLEGPSFAFTRFSPGFLTNFYIPVGSGKHAFFIGAGPQYHFLNFEEYSANKLGIKAQVGMSLTFGKFNLQPFGSFNYVKGVDTNANGNDFELDFTGGQIGVYLSFHSPVAHK